MKPWPYTRKYRSRNAWRIDYRRHGHIVRLNGEPGTTEFQASYDAAKARLETERHIDRTTVGQGRSDKPKHGILRWLAAEYFRSSEFRSNLGADAQVKKRSTLEYCLLEPIAPDHPQRIGDLPLAILEAKHIRVLRDRKTEAPTMANHRLMALGSLFRWAVQHNHLRHNPAVEVQRLRITSQGHPAT
jgi:hypothetical protein